MSNPYDATASVLGYLFQCRVALADAIPRLRSDGSFTVALETLEDVVFEKQGQPAELLQTKHHIQTSSGLGDASTDLWKTLRGWADGYLHHRWPADSLHYLITTSTAQAGSIASFLRQDGRDVVKARDRLDQIARTSGNQEHKPLYEAYLKLSPAERLSLLERTVIFDRSPNIAGVAQRLRQELTLTVHAEHLDSFIQRLEGWWFQRVILHLQRTNENEAIRSEELAARIDYLRDQYLPTNLPIDEDLTTVEIDESTFMNHVFVAQLRLLGIAGRRVLHAMRQYYRASEQRSRWLREGILRFGELHTYDRRLCEEWDIRFTQMLDDLGNETAEEEMVKAAKVLYKWAEQDASFLIRPACNEPFICRGSLQMLADACAVGWHPKFGERLKDLVQEAS